MRWFRRQRRWRSRQVRRRTEGDIVRAASRRLIVMRLVVVLALAVLSVQLVRFQLLDSGRYRLEATDNRLRTESTTASRGLILDRNGNELVRNVPSFSAVVIPADIPKGQEATTYYQLSTIIGVPPDVIAQMVATSLQRSDPFTAVKVKSQLDQTTVLTLAELRDTLPGINVQYDATRQYANSTLLSHIFGYTGRITADQYNNLKDRGYSLNDFIGQTGVEYTYEDQLRGTPGTRTTEVDAAGRELRTISGQPPKAGNNVQLTIDLDLQQHFTDILQKWLTKTGSADGVVAMMDVHTGELLALVSLPNYDANVFSGPIADQTLNALLNDPGKPLVDHAISDQYPPGSTFKTITAAAALQAGTATTATTVDSKGSFCFGDEPAVKGTNSCVYDWQPQGFGDLNLLQGLALSSDIYFYCLAGGCHPSQVDFEVPGVQMDPLAKFAKQFGLGSPTGIDLPDEAPGIIPDTNYVKNLKNPDGTPYQSYIGDTYFMGVGQGFDAATPLQMLGVASAIANGGDVLRPHVVKDVLDASGNVIVPEGSSIVRHLGISSANLATVRQGMRMAVEGDYFTSSAYTAFVPGLKIAGKTGTAEYGSAIAAPQGDKIDNNGSYNEHGWFISFAPYDNPQVALVIFHDKGNGAATAAASSTEIWSYYFNQWLPNHPRPKPSFSGTPVPGSTPLTPTPGPTSLRPVPPAAVPRRRSL